MPRVLIVVALALAGCATMPMVRVDQGPPQAQLLALETKIQDDSRHLEEKLAREGALHDDPALTEALETLGRRLIPPEVQQGSLTYQFRVVRDPTVNAYALPNGRSYYHLGLLARLRNPDMLAAIMAHELSHTVHRDILYWLDDLHQKTVVAKLAEMVFVPAFGGLASLTVNVAYASSVTGYGRDREAAADQFAIERLHAIGMNPAATVQMFEVLLHEEERYRRGAEIWFLMDHPTTRRRLAEMREWLAAHTLGALTPPPDDPDFLALTDPARFEAAALNIRFERYFHALDLVEELLNRRPQDVAALTLRAECYRGLADSPKAAEAELSEAAWGKTRARNSEVWRQEWQAKAVEAFREALAVDPAWAEAVRGLGMLHLARDERPQAIEQLERYLALQPAATDKRYVTSQLVRLRQPQEAKR